MPIKNDHAFSQLPKLNSPLPGVEWVTDKFITQMSELLELSAIDLNTLRQKIKTHLDGNYTHVNALKDTLASISQLLDSPSITSNIKVDAATNLQDGFLNCTQGLHVRVNHAYVTLNTPKTLPELLSTVRYEYVDYLARKISSMNLVEKNMQVHLYNLVFSQAYQEGFVSDVSVDDAYSTNVRQQLGENGLKKLDDFFKELNMRSGLFCTAKDVLNKMTHFLTIMGYQGKCSDPNGYCMGVYEPILGYLNHFFKSKRLDSSSMSTFFIMEEREDSFATPIVDLNWPVIKQFVVELLIRDYFYVNDNDRLKIKGWFPELDEVFVTENTSVALANMGSRDSLLGHGPNETLACLSLISNDHKKIQDVLSVYLPRSHISGLVLLACEVSEQHLQILKNMRAVGEYTKTLSQKPHLSSLFEIMIEIIFSDKSFDELYARLNPFLPADLKQSNNIDKLFSWLFKLSKNSLPFLKWFVQKENIQSYLSQNSALHIKDRHSFYRYATLTMLFSNEKKSNILIKYLDRFQNEREKTIELNAIYQHLQTSDPDFISYFKDSPIVREVIKEASHRLKLSKKHTTIESLLISIRAFVENDSEFMRLAISRHPIAYKYASVALRYELRHSIFPSDRPVCLALLEYLPIETLNDIEFLLALLKRRVTFEGVSPNTFNALPETLKDNEAFFLMLAEKQHRDSVSSIKFASLRLQNDESFILKLLNIYPDYYSSLPPQWKERKDIAFSVIQAKYYLYNELPCHFKRDEEIILYILKKDASFLINIPFEANIFQNKEELLEILTNNNFKAKYLYRNMSRADDPYFLFLKQLSALWGKDEDILSCLVHLCPKIYLDISPEMQANLVLKKMVLCSKYDGLNSTNNQKALLKETYRSILKELNENIEEDLFLKILEPNSGAYYDIPKKQVTAKIALYHHAFQYNKPNFLHRLKHHEEWNQLLQELVLVTGKETNKVAKILFEQDLCTIEKARSYLQQEQLKISTSGEPLDTQSIARPSEMGIFSGNKHARSYELEEEKNVRQKKL